MEQAATAPQVEMRRLSGIPDRLKISMLVLLLGLLAVFALRAYMSYQSFELAVAGAQANEEGQAKLAKKLLSRALALSPNDPQVRYQLATAQMLLGDLDGSLAIYLEARDLGGGDGGTLLNDLGLRHLSAIQLVQASALFQGALTEHPADANYRLNLAAVHRRQGKLLSERLETELAVALGASQLRPLLRLSELELRAGRPAAALAPARKAADLFPRVPAALSNLAKVQEALSAATDGTAVSR